MFANDTLRDTAQYRPRCDEAIPEGAVIPTNRTPLAGEGGLSRATLAGILEIANDAIVSVDDRHRIILFNQGAENIFGYAAHEVLGRPLSLLVPLHVAERHAQHVDAFLHSPERARRIGGRSEIVGRRKDGSQFPAEASISKVDLDGQLVMTAILRDVTERNRVEEDLRHLASIVAASEDAIIATTPEMIVISWNRGAEKTFGFSAEEMKGRSVWLLVPPEKADEIALIHGRLQGGYFLKEYETVRMAKDGRRVHVSISISPHWDASGRITGYSGIVRDITERKRADARLHDLRTALEATVQGIARVDRDGRFLTANDAYAALIGYPVEELIGMECAKVVHRDDQQRFEEAHGQMLRSGKAEVEVRAACKDGFMTYQQVVMIRVDEEGELAGHYCFVKDITSRKQMEARIEASLREKDLLLKEIHHRVKNNLQLISSLLHLQSSQIQDERVREMFKESQDRIQAVAFVHEKLYQSRDLARVDLAEYIRSLTSHLLSSYNVTPGDVTVDIQVNEALLDFDVAMSCCLIISELLSNALKHAFVRGKRGRVWIELGSKGEDTQYLVVRDDGVGFPSGVDFRATTSLGLQLVCALVEQLGGTIALDRNHGTTWAIAYPAVRGT